MLPRDEQRWCADKCTPAAPMRVAMIKKSAAILAVLVIGPLVVLLVLLALSWEEATVDVRDGYGPHPLLPPPHKTIIPTINFAKAVGFPEGVKPIAADGFSVNAFAEKLDHPRWLHVLPNGDILVAESARPERPQEGISFEGVVGGWVTSQAGSGVRSANRITLLRDADGDGVAEIRSAFLQNLNSPFGMALAGGKFYVANTDAIVMHPYGEGDLQISGAGQRIAELPASEPNLHWTRDMLSSPDGTKLYISVGANSERGEHGLESEVNRAAILELDLDSMTIRVFASGLRNPNGLTWNPVTGALWVAVNERDLIGSDLVPDYMTSVRDGGFYGWPYTYFGRVDELVQPQRPDLQRTTIMPDYALGPHTASVGLTFNTYDRLGTRYRDGVFVGQHGSWNRRPRSGYKVIFVPFTSGEPSGAPMDFLTGFLNSDGEAYGRPAGVAFDRTGALLVADDVGNKIWRVVPSSDLRR